MNLGEVTIVALVFGLAGLVKGAIGLGLPTISMGLLGALMPPGQAAAILIVPALATNAWQIWALGASMICRYIYSAGS